MLPSFLRLQNLGHDLAPENTVISAANASPKGVDVNRPLKPHDRWAAIGWRGNCWTDSISLGCERGVEGLSCTSMQRIDLERSVKGVDGLAQVAP